MAHSEPEYLEYIDVRAGRDSMCCRGRQLLKQAGDGHPPSPNRGVEALPTLIASYWLLNQRGALALRQVTDRTGGRGTFPPEMDYDYDYDNDPDSDSDTGPD